MNKETIHIDFILVGHSCPIRSYPAPVIPIGHKKNKKNKLVAIYLTKETNIDFFPIDIKDENIVIYNNNDLTKKLSRFNCSKHKLFAFSENQIEYYPLQEEKNYFQDLLKNKNSPIEDPFLRLSLAKVTEDTKIILSEIRRCTIHFLENYQDDQDDQELLEELLVSWYQNQKTEIDYLWKRKNYLRKGKKQKFPSLKQIKKDAIEIEN